MTEELTIERLGLHGDGVAPGPVFAARCLPGETVEGEIEGDRMVAPRILTPSPSRVAAPCRHFKTCGGCAMQHASDSLVAEWKADILRRALKAQGVEGEIAGVHTSPDQSRRRAKLSGRRTKKGALVGFHARGSDTIVSIPDCKLLTPSLVAQLPMLEALTQIAASRTTEVGLTITETVNGPDVLVDTERELTRELRAELGRFAHSHHLSRLVWKDEPVATLQPPSQNFGAAAVAPPPGAFLQATRDGERALTAAVRGIIGDSARVVDLFSGCGTFTLPLAETAEVHAVESEAAMLAALDKGWRVAPGLKKVTTETRDLFRRPLLPDEIERFDAVVMDPPRAGAEAQTREIADSKTRCLAMVSCNPVTFARDARILTEAGFHMGPITVIDQFRWSAHVELVAGFTR